MANQRDPTKQWWAQFDARTSDLSMAEYGAFRLLANYLYVYSELPIAREQVYVIARASSAAERVIVDGLLHKRFRLDSAGRWRNLDIEAMVSKRNAFRTRYDMRMAAAESLAPITAARKANKDRHASAKTSIILVDTDPRTFPLPTWVPRDAWVEFCEMRRTMEESNNPRALQSQVLSLDVLRQIGGDAGKILRHVIRRKIKSLREVRSLSQALLRDSESGSGAPEVQEPGRPAQA